MTGTLIVIILICGFLALVQAVNSLSENPRAFLPVTVILAVLYTMLVGSIWFVYMAFSRNNLVIYGGLAFVVIVMLILFTRFVANHRDSMSRGYAIAFLLYAAVVLYVTIFSRKTGSDSSVMEHVFHGVELAIAERSWEPMRHSLLNAAMFLPFGYLIPCMNRYYLARWGFAVIGGLVTSTVIESVQMIYSRGQCDIDDIIFNTIGAAVGYLFFVFLRRVRKNWRLFS